MQSTWLKFFSTLGQYANPHSNLAFQLHIWSNRRNMVFRKLTYKCLTPYCLRLNKMQLPQKNSQSLFPPTVTPYDEQMFKYLLFSRVFPHNMSNYSTAVRATPNIFTTTDNYVPYVPTSRLNPDTYASNRQSSQPNRNVNSRSPQHMRTPPSKVRSCTRKGTD